MNQGVFSFFNYTSVGQMLRGRASHLLGSLLAATFVRLRLIVGLRFPALVSLHRSKSAIPLQQFNRFGGLPGCQRLRGRLSPFWGSFLAAAFAIQSGSSWEHLFRACGAIFGTRRVFALPLPQKIYTARLWCSRKSLSLRPTP